MAPASKRGPAVTRKCQNEFFCGLHFLVGLADQAQACLKLWENILLKGQSIGSLVHGGYSNGESGTIHLIRMICKAVSHWGCKKSGRITSFEFCMEEKYILSFSIYDFLGNPFKVLFRNAAGVYYLPDHLVDFFDNTELENIASCFSLGLYGVGLQGCPTTWPYWNINHWAIVENNE